MRIAVVGAGIAGTTLAYWLRRSGHVPTLIEKATRLRTGGYVIDFWGPSAENEVAQPQIRCGHRDGQRRDIFGGEVAIDGEQL